MKQSIEHKCEILRRWMMDLFSQLFKIDGQLIEWTICVQLADLDVPYEDANMT